MRQPAREAAAKYVSLDITSGTRFFPLKAPGLFSPPKILSTFPQPSRLCHYLTYAPTAMFRSVANSARACARQSRSSSSAVSSNVRRNLHQEARQSQKSYSNLVGSIAAASAVAGTLVYLSGGSQFVHYNDAPLSSSFNIKEGSAQHAQVRSKIYEVIITRAQVLLGYRCYEQPGSLRLGRQQRRCH